MRTVNSLYRSSIQAWEFHQNRSIKSSVHSSRPNLKAPEWDCGSAARLSSLTAVACGRVLIPGLVQHFSSSCLSKRRHTKPRNFRTRQTATFTKCHLAAAPCGPSFEASGELVAVVSGHRSRNSEFLHFGNQCRPLQPKPSRCTAGSANNPTSYLQCLQN